MCFNFSLSLFVSPHQKCLQFHPSIEAHTHHTTLSSSLSIDTTARKDDGYGDGDDDDPLAGMEQHRQSIAASITLVVEPVSPSDFRYPCRLHDQTSVYHHLKMLEIKTDFEALKGERGLPGAMEAFHASITLNHDPTNHSVLWTAVITSIPRIAVRVVRTERQAILIRA